MSSALRLAFAVAPLYALAITPSAAQEATSRFMRWNWQYQTERMDRAERLYSETRARAAAASPRATRELVLQMDATVDATKRMLVTALKAAKTIEAKGAVLDGLIRLELDDADMSLVAREVALKDPWISALESKASRISDVRAKAAFNWLARYEMRDFLTAYPACDVLSRQGKRAIPILRESLPNFAAGTVGFKNTAHLLVLLSSVGENQACALGEASSLSREQRDAFLSVMKICGNSVAVTPCAAQDAMSRFVHWGLKYQFERIERAGRLYSEARAQAAAASPRATRDLVLQMEATVGATQQMLVAALKAAKTIEAKVAILDGLIGSELDDAEMSLVAREVALQDAWITALESQASQISNANVRAALNWLAGYERRDFLTAYPACDVLRRQGKRAVPILRESLPNFAADSLGFKNTVHLLLLLSPLGENKAWALEDDSSLSREQRGAFLKLMKER
jgi:hypothetical protein